MVLVVDIGNSRVKCAVYELFTLVDFFVFEVENFFKNFENILETRPEITVLVVASVGKINQQAFNKYSNRLKIKVIARSGSFPFVNKYATPDTLGIDRMVLAAGAVLQFPNTNRLVIDAGTCVTYDLVNCNNEYLGGAISPGLGMRYKAMHEFTAQLPLLNPTNPNSIIGNTTTNGMHSGAVHGLSFEIDGYINSVLSLNEKFIIILTGGDANFLAKRLKNTIFANSNFLLESLNNLYRYQND